jgi:hypothetical protein
VKKTEGPNRSVAYVYFDYKASENLDVETVIRSLLVQILFSQSLIPREIEDMYYLSAHKSTAPDTLKLKQHLLAFVSRLSSFVLFDALDELSGKYVTEIMALIRKISESGARVLYEPHKYRERPDSPGKSDSR